MSGFDDGPLTGAPLNFPQSAQRGECCPPVVAIDPTSPFEVDAGVPSTVLNLAGILFSDVQSIEVYGVGPVASVNSFVVTEGGGAPTLDTLAVDLDTQGIGLLGFYLAVTNGCGCSDLIPVLPQPPP